MASIRIAAAQLRASRLDDSAAALTDIHRAVEQAAASGAELLVLPECAYPAYCLGSVAAYRAANVMRSPAFLADLADRAREHRLHIVCGFVEDRGDALANAAVLIDDRGERVGVYRKTFLWGDDNDVFVPGDETRPFETRWGKVGIIICADARAPETIAAHAAQGAELICMPTCWVNIAKSPGEFYNPQPDFLITARAREFAVPFVCANKFGRETESISYCGQSLIVDHQGRRLAEATPDAETLLFAEVRTHRAAAAPVSAEARDILDSDTPAVGPTAQPGEPTMVVLQGDQILTYVEARVAALRGATGLVVKDAPDEIAILRARAVENRVYVVAVSPRGVTAIAPDGSLLKDVNPADPQWWSTTFDPRRAADKMVFPKTHIWEQRRPSACRAAFEM